MGRKKRLRVADLAREAGISESEAVERLRRNGMEAREGYRIAPRDLRRVREILAGENEAAVVRQQQEPKPATTDGHEDEGQSAEVRMTIQDAVEAWLSMNPAPKHFKLAGKSYDDFVRNSYQFLLGRALRQGATSTSVMVGSEDIRQIEAFLDRGKALWNKRRQEEQTKEDARRRADEQRQAEERQRIEQLHKSEQQRQAKLLREDNRRLEEARKQAEDRRRLEERRAVEEQRRQEAQRELRRQAELAARKDEESRIDRVFSRHRQTVANKRGLLQAERCSWADYYAFVLRDRIERSAELLFGSAEHPSYELLQKNPELLEKLKGNLSFSDDQHPGDYQDPYVSAYYTLRYELGYAFEYSQVYGVLLSIMRQKNEMAPLDVLSIGSGQGLDYWGLRYALSKQEAYRPKIGWHGIDLERWPDHILDDGLARYSDGTDVLKLLSGMRNLDAKVLMFPKVISELPSEAVYSIASWLEHVTLTRDAHYLCFAHTERKSLDPSDWKRKGDKDCFHGTTEPSLDAVKSAAIISAACNSAGRQSYTVDAQWCDPNMMSVNYYNVAWPNARNGGEWLCRYPYLVYNDKAGNSDWPVWRDDLTFEMNQRLRDIVKGIGSSCCTKYIPIENGYYDTGNTDCDIRRVGCNDAYLCPLHRYPRFKTGRMAYQIVRLVKRPN